MAVGGVKRMFIPIHDDNPLRSIPMPWVTWALIALNIAAFLGELTPQGETVIASFALVPTELFKMGIRIGAAGGPYDVLPVPEMATLISHLFLHGDALHLATNMAFLWVFGDNVEDAVGHWRFLLFYLLCGIAAGLAHAFALKTSTVPLIGASGAVAGVIAAYLMLHPRVKVWILAVRFIPLNVSAAIALGLWVVAQFAMLFVRDTGEVAWWAHVGGIIAGAALILVLRKPDYPLFDARLRTAIAAKDTTSPSS